MSVNWQLLQTGDPAGALQAGIQQGQAMRRDLETRGALSALARNPGDQQAIGALAAYAPDVALKMQDRQREMTARTLAQQAAGGDRAAQQQLYAYDPDLASKFDERQRKMFDVGMKALGEAAYGVALEPEDRRATAWDSYIERLAAMFPDVAQYRGRYSPENLNAVLAQTGKLQDVMKAREPDYMSVPEGGRLVNTRDPAALAEAASQPAAPQQGTSIPNEAISFLKANPDLAGAFDAKFGAGASQRYLSGGPTQPASAGFP